MFELEGFVVACRAALAADAGGHRAVRALLTRTVGEPAQVMAGLGEPQRAGLTALHRAADLTILNVVWGPGMTIMPHDHRMWAAIGVYTGGEDNIFWRRLPGGTVEAAGAQSLRARDCAVLGRDIVHSVTNPLGRLTGAIHIYGGDFFAAERSEWDPETLCEGRYDTEKARRLFEASDRR
jgi:predicted metal-dependent enzyme (double-stranded beta helix superfamily)